MSCGLAERTEDRVALVHPEMAEIVTRSSDQLHYVQTILRVFESTSGTIDELAATLVTALEDSIAARYGPDYVPKPEEMDEVARLIQDYRDLGSRGRHPPARQGAAAAHGVRRFRLHRGDGGRADNGKPGSSAYRELIPASSRGRRRTAAPATPG